MGILSFFHPVIKKVRKENLTFLGEYPLYDIYSSIKHLERKKISGVFIEAGVALGGSAIVIASAKKISRPLFLYDVFAMIPPPSPKDGEDVIKRYNLIKAGLAKGIAGDRYYGYEVNLLNKVQNSFMKMGIDPETHHVTMVKGLFNETLHIQTPVAFAHLDGDWYESTYVCLERIWEHVSVGGRIIVDDYYHWSGCKLAVDDFFSNRKDFKFLKRSRLHIVKI